MLRRVRGWLSPNEMRELACPFPVNRARWSRRTKQRAAASCSRAAERQHYGPGGNPSLLPPDPFAPTPDDDA